MVLVWIGIGLGILIAIIMLRKIVKTPPHEAIKFELYCKRCGYKTNGLKCPRCENASNRQSWR